MRYLTFTAWTMALCLGTASAQPAPRKEAVQFAVTERASRVEVRPPGIRFGLHKPREFALAPLSESEFARFTEPSTRLKIGIERALPPEALASGLWESTAAGLRVWRMAVRSPGSRGMRVEFRNFDVGGGSVWVHDGTQFDGPFTGKGMYGNGEFWSGNLLHDSVILEYVPAPDQPAEGLPPFEIHTIAHHVRSILDGPGSDAGVVNTADYCELDPNCFPDWQSAMSTVGQILYQDSGSTYVCSGSLLATRDNSFKPYFLTAGHCINTEAAARTVQAYWTYQTSSCAGAPPASRDTSAKSSTGGHLINWGTIEAGDYSLVLLPDVPSGVTFAGWDPNDPPLGAGLTGIHHPSGSWKRISFGQRVADDSGAIANGANIDVAPANLYLQILWDRGRVEHGSSGSPLFSGPGVVVGNLSYGEVAADGTVCGINPSVAGYTRFSNTYKQVSDYLENLPAAEVKADKTSLAFTIVDRVPPAAQSVQLSTQSASQATFKLRADAPWIQLSASNGTISSKTGAPVSISVDTSQLAQPGKYASTVTILSGAAPPQFINVTVTVRLDQSNVIPTISPNPVVQSGGQWSFQIQLLETAGSSTRLTGIKVNGTDYSSSIANWFGTNHIGANQALVAPLHGTGVFPAGDQYFEFWGIDDGSNLPWYRVTTVTFR